VRIVPSSSGIITLGGCLGKNSGCGTGCASFSDFVSVMILLSGISGWFDSAPLFAQNGLGSEDVLYT
jgi:hypothetical protein